MRIIIQNPMLWSFMILRFSLVHSFVSRTTLGISHPASAKSPVGRLVHSHKTSFLRAAEVLSKDREAFVDNGDNSLSTDGTTILADSAAFVKPDRDRYDYRIIKLKNNLKVLLVSTAEAKSQDSAATVEAASMHIQAGHFDDTVPGLAHFYEHMLFLGTEKYPEEDAYETFLSRFGGFGNAYTDMEDTNYYFSITTQNESADETSEGLEGSLDRLAQFFISPQFNADMAERELRAIDSEYRNGKTNDSWRNFQLLKAVSNQKHPFSNFGCGNYQTLMQKGKAPIDELHEFLGKYYTTSNMCLAVVGSSKLDALQASVERTFGALKHSHESPRREKENPEAKVFVREHAVYGTENPAFGPEELGKYREVIPLLESRSVKIQFATPPLEDPALEKAKPYRVLSHLLGHESPGSLHQLLTDFGYLTSLTSGTAIDTSDFGLFGLTLSLTPKGMKHKEEILDLVFQWIALIRKTALENPELISKYHDELRQISDTNFKFRENGDPTDFCSAASSLLFDTTDPTEFLRSGSDTSDYDPILAKEFLERFRPENCMITVTDSGLSESDDKDWLVEPLYGATYREKELTETDIRKWESLETIDERLHLPDLNQYIPTDFSLRCDDKAEKLTETQLSEARGEPPTLLHSGQNWRVFHKMDRSWRVPKASIRLSIVTPMTYQSPRAMTLSRIYQRVLNDDLNSFVYDASLAGCNYRISCVPTGYKLSVSGYSEKLPFLLDALTSRMLTLTSELREGKEKHPALFEKFERAKDNLLRETKNYRLDVPYEVANYNARLLMEESVWFLDNYIDLMEGNGAEKDPLTMEQCADIAQVCLTGSLKVNSLLMGNIDDLGAKQVTDVLSKHFIEPSKPLHDAELPRFRSMMLPTKEEAAAVFGNGVESNSIPIKYQEIAASASEENNAIELTLQSGCDVGLGHEGIATMDLLSQLAYNSAYNQLRTKEQLGYIVSAFTRKLSGGSWGLSIVVQSSTVAPVVLEERVEEWLKAFRQELESMDPEVIAMEAQGVVSQLLEADTKLSQEVGSAWNEIVATETYNERMTTPPFDRLERLADELVLDTSKSSPTMNGNKRKSAKELKEYMLKFFDDFYAADAPQRRVMSSRVFSQNSKAEYEAELGKPGVLSSYEDIRYLKGFLSTWPSAPYWSQGPRA